MCLMCHGGVILEKWWLQNWVNTEPIKKRFPHTMFGASWLQSTCCGKFWETCEDFSPRAGISRRVENLLLCRRRHRTALCPVLPAWPHYSPFVRTEGPALHLLEANSSQNEWVPLSPCKHLPESLGEADDPSWWPILLSFCFYSLGPCAIFIFSSKLQRQCHFVTKSLLIPFYRIWLLSTAHNATTHYQCYFTQLESWLCPREIPASLLPSAFSTDSDQQRKFSNL